MRHWEDPEIKHFLLSLDPPTGRLQISEFGTDYDTAQAAYAGAERADVDQRLNIVLISANSLATIEQTHSSYFNGGPDQLRKHLADAAFLP